MHLFVQTLSVLLIAVGVFLLLGLGWALLLIGLAGLGVSVAKEVIDGPRPTAEPID